MLLNALTRCRFAQRVSLIKNKALINEEQDPSVMIRRLKNEVLTLREEIAFLKVRLPIVDFEYFRCAADH